VAEDDRRAGRLRELTEEVSCGFGTGVVVSASPSDLDGAGKRDSRVSTSASEALAHEAAHSSVDLRISLFISKL
jgi:hypothetical protein